MVKINRINKQRFRYIIWLFVIALAIYTFTFSPSAIQDRNMKQAAKEVTAAKKVLKKDTRFSDVNFIQSTASLGKQIIVMHSCDNEKDLLTLKGIISNSFNSKYHFTYVFKGK